MKNQFPTSCFAMNKLDKVHKASSTSTTRKMIKRAGEHRKTKQ